MEREKKFILSSISTIICESFLFCLLALLIFSFAATNKITNNIKENIKMNVFLKKINQTDVKRIIKTLNNNKYVKNVEFISKEKAASNLTEILGKDFLNILDGINPLSDCIDVTLKSEFTTLENYKEINFFLKKEFDEEIYEIKFHENLIEKINYNMNKIIKLISLFSIILFIITIFLIKNTIRINIRNEKNIIKTMKLVGATNKFIKTPYLKNSIFSGLISIIISIILFLIITLTINKNLNIFYNESLLNIITFTCVFIIIIGILINYMSTLIITNNNLKKIN